VIVAVTGASGLLGGNIAAVLAAEGHTVRCTRRDRSRVGHLTHLDLDWVDAPLDDGDKLTAAFSGAEIVIHAAALTRMRPKPTKDLLATNVEGTRHVVDAVRRAGVRRLVHVSTTAAVGVSEDGNPIDETAPWNMREHGLDDGYATTKRQAEELVLRAVREQGLDAVVVNPCYLFGPLDVRPTSGRMILEVAAGRAWFAARGRNCYADVRDVARGAWAAAQRGRTGERYILGGDNLTYRQVFTLIAEVTGGRPPLFDAEPALARLVGLLGDAKGALTGKEARLDSVRVRWGLETGFVFTSAKARRELGYTTGPLRDAIADAWAWFNRD
jgi:dihydroflavonol-4-reductase